MYRSIAVGTDGSPRAAAAVEAATRLAATFAADLHIVCGYQPASQALVLSAVHGAAVSGLPSDDQVRDAMATEVEAQAGAARDLGVPYQVHVVPGDGAHACLEVAEANGCDLIVVGSRGMTGVRRMLGSVPNNIAHHAGCSVLIVNTA